MKNKDSNQVKEIKIPELKVPGIIKDIIDWITHIKYIYKIILFAIILALIAKLIPSNVLIDLWDGIRTNKTIINLLILFCFVAVSLTWTIGQTVDEWIFILLNSRGNRPAFLDWFMLATTQMGNFLFACLVAIILFIKNNSLIAYELLLGVVTLGLMIEIIKLLIRRIRPYIKLKKIRIVGAKASGRSFPSGHTAQAFFLASLLAHYYHVPVLTWILLYATALLVGITRIYVGMHYPRDVLGGAILGTVWGIIGFMLNGYIR